MTKTITLPSGKTAILKQGKGYDLLQAQIKAKNPEEIIYALISELTEIDGQQLVYEDILELDLADVLALQGELSGKFQTAPQKKEVQTIKQQPQPALLNSPMPNASSI